MISIKISSKTFYNKINLQSINKASIVRLMLNFLSKFGLKPYKKQVVVHGFIRPRPTPKPRAGQHTRPLPLADEESVCWRSGRKNQGKAQARRFFRVTARGHSLLSAPAKNKSLEISLNRAVSRLFFIQ